MMATVRRPQVKTMPEISYTPFEVARNVFLVVSSMFAASPAFGQDTAPAQGDSDVASQRAELETYWAEVSRAVAEGDFAAYQQTCHPRAVLVSGVKKTSYPLSQALQRWKVEFDDTRAGRRKSSVTFRFSHRFGDATTAHEAGIFLYEFQLPNKPSVKEFVHFEALLVKEQGDWQILMEYQKSRATVEEWSALSMERY